MTNYITKYIFHGERDSIKIGENGVVAIHLLSERIDADILIENASLTVTHLKNNRLCIKNYKTSVFDMYVVDQYEQSDKLFVAAYNKVEHIYRLNHFYVVVSSNKNKLNFHYNIKGFGRPEEIKRMINAIKEEKVYV